MNTLEQFAYTLARNEPNKQAWVVIYRDGTTQSYSPGETYLAFRAFRGITYGAARPAKAVGYLMGLSGFAYIVQGWVLGSRGFSDANTIPTLLGYISMIIWSIWLLVVAWRMQATSSAPALNRRSVGNY